MTKQEKAVLVEGLKKLSADVADLAARLEGSPAPKETQDEPAVETAPAPMEAAPTKVCTYEETRAVLVEKSRARFRAEFKALLAEFGVSQLSDVKDPGKLAEIVKKAEGIGNHIQVIVHYLISFPTGGSCSEFPNSWIFVQFSIFKYVLNVFTDIRFAAVVQFYKLRLC